MPPSQRSGRRGTNVRRVEDCRCVSRYHPSRSRAVGRGERGADVSRAFGSAYGRPDRATYICADAQTVVRADAAPLEAADAASDFEADATAHSPSDLAAHDRGEGRARGRTSDTYNDAPRHRWVPCRYHSETVRPTRPVRRGP